MDDSEKQCDVDDIICQLEVLTHLKGLQSALGDERYRTDFPELQGLDEKVRGQETALREVLSRCGNPLPEEMPAPEVPESEEL